jgi:hypothetical protein
MVRDSMWWLAGRHAWTESEEREWVTELVAHGSSTEVLIGVRLECNLLTPGLALPTPKKPYIIRMLLTALGGGADADMLVHDEPTFLSESQVATAVSLLDGSAMLHLPVVYLSALPNHRPYPNPDKLAERLAGMAHVVVEPSRHFSFALARNSERRNPYAGAADIIWPRGLARSIRFLPRDYDSGHAMEIDIASCVRRGLISARPTPVLTWAYTQELVAAKRLESLRLQGSAELDDYVEAFDAELKAKQARLDEAEGEIGRLQAEVRRLANASTSTGGLIGAGKEQEYYPGELREAIVYALGLARGQLDPAGRRLHIVDDVIAANNTTRTSVEIAEQIKRTFSASGELTVDARRLLVDLGFYISDEGKHYKAVFQGDGRYTFAISKTPSDHRAGRNLASTINRKLFK